MNTITEYYTPYQLKLPLEISILIDVDDPIYTFSEVMNHIDLKSYFVENDCKMGRPRCDSVKLVKIILSAFMEGGYKTLHILTKLCKTDIRYMWLLDGMAPPSHASFGNFIRNELADNIEDIFKDINSYIFQTEGVDLQHAYIDGTKIEANANKYSWVWKNKYERTEEIYVCEDCTNCSIRSQCTKSKKNRTIRLNEELASIHEEVLANLESVHGALLRMNRSIQAEGTHGTITWNRRYARAYRRGIESVKLEFLLVSCGFNLHKFHNKKNRAKLAA